jgi:hypothetical protein
MDAVMEVDSATVTRATVSARVYADARKLFAAEIDDSALETQVTEVLETLWTESTKVMTFIPVLALRDLRDRIGSEGGRSNQL